MSELFVDFETAKKMKKLMFNEECDFSYTVDGGESNNMGRWKNSAFVHNITKPAYSQAKEWLWKEKGIYLSTAYDFTKKGFHCTVLDEDHSQLAQSFRQDDSPIEAEKEGIILAVDYLTKKS